MMSIEIGGSEFALMADRTVLFKEGKALLCSDLHWGREAYLQKFGMGIPAFSFTIESKILTSALIASGARELWILGDFIHHPDGLHESLFLELKNWLEYLASELKVEVSFIPGNHDRKFNDWAAKLPLKLCPSGIQTEHFTFLHEPPRVRENQKFHWYGHLHPSIRIEKLFGNRKLPCFLIRENEAYLPAFSRLAGGAQFESFPTDRIYAVAEAQVFKVGR